MIEPNELKDFWVTSDLWLGRNQILEIAKRNRWRSIDEMNTALVQQWNERVSDSDYVICLGNFAWDPLTARRALDALNGTIYFMLGNADDALLEVYQEFSNVAVIENSILSLPSHDLVLCHYPMAMWPGKDSGTVHLHGHAVYSHLTNLATEKRFNMCSDHWGHSPIKVSTLKDLVNDFEK